MLTIPAKIFSLTLFATLLLAGCASGTDEEKKEASTSESQTGSDQPTDDQAKDADVGLVEQPVNVAGGFGLVMTCDRVETGTGGKIKVGCALYENNGERYEGTIDNLATMVSYKDGKNRPGTVAPGDKEQFDFFVETSEGDVFAVEAVFNSSGKEIKISARIYANSQKTVANLTLYVAKTGAANSECSQAKPCSSINRALAVLPERIDHSVIIEVAAVPESDPEPYYTEPVYVTGKDIGITGALTIKGPSPLNPFRIRPVPISNDSKDPVTFRIRSMTGQIVVENADLTARLKGSEEDIESSVALHIQMCDGVILINTAVRGGYAGLTVDDARVFIRNEFLAAKSLIGVIVKEYASLDFSAANTRLIDNTSYGLYVPSSGGNITVTGGQIEIKGSNSPLHLNRGFMSVKGVNRLEMISRGYESTVTNGSQLSFTAMPSVMDKPVNNEIIFDSIVVSNSSTLSFTSSSSGPSAAKLKIKWSPQRIDNSVSSPLIIGPNSSFTRKVDGTVCSPIANADIPFSKVKLFGIVIVGYQTVFKDTQDELLSQILGCSP